VFSVTEAHSSIIIRQKFRKTDSIFRTETPGRRTVDGNLHDRVFVKGRGASSYLEEVRDFLHGAAFVRGVAALSRWRAVSFSEAGFVARRAPLVTRGVT
jgi:hypothetical protein